MFTEISRKAPSQTRVYEWVLILIDQLLKSGLATCYRIDVDELVFTICFATIVV